jgi:hypothetical protein
LPSLKRGTSPARPNAWAWGSHRSVQQIKALEAQLGIQLFRRKPRGVELTESGKVLLDEHR